MSTKTEKAKPESEPEVPEAPKPVFGVLFQLEDMAWSGRKAAFDVLKKALAGHKATLTPALFARFCFNTAPSVYVPALVESFPDKKLSADKLTEDVAAGIAAAAASESARLHPALSKMLDAALERDMAIGVISALPEEVAQGLVAKLGLSAIGAQLTVFKNGEKAFPRPDTWLKTAREMSLKAGNCVVLAASMTACKTALSADMRCVAVPDEFTSFQDFGGANFVLENLGEISPKELFDAVFPAEKKETK